MSMFQGDRLVYVVLGFAPDNIDCWVLDYGVFLGDPLEDHSVGKPRGEAVSALRWAAAGERRECRCRVFDQYRFKRNAASVVDGGFRAFR